MRPLKSTLSCILLSSICYGQNIEFNANDIEDPAIFEINQNKPHVSYIPYNSFNGVLSEDVVSDNLQLLNGMWDFMWAETPKESPSDFYLPEYNSEQWDKIKVPSNWQCKGYGHPKFRNISLSFESDYPKSPNYYNPTGCYKKKFNIPDSWTEKDVFLRFEGIKSASYIWVNGQKVGYNQGGFEPAEFNITPFLHAGENDISVKVIRFCDGSYLENQDMWRLSGIYRDVKLIAVPKVHIHDFFITTTFDKTYTDGMLNIDVDLLNNSQKADANFEIQVDILDENNKTILNEPIKYEDKFNNTNTSQSIKLSTLVDHPKKWSAEDPNLYTILFTLKNSLGETTEIIKKRFGFRHVELNDEVLLVNGIPVKLNGVNSHMHDPISGQTVPLSTLRKDLILMKQHNINCVRTCHYPPTPEYLDLADEIGMYIIDEVSDEAHSNIELSDNMNYTEMYNDRCRKLVHRDRNHVSVLMWSAGNESGSGQNIKSVIQTGIELDPTRLAWMYGGNTFYIPFEPVTGPRYWTPYLLKCLAESKILGENDLRPAFMDEYLAATGNSLGGLDEYWDLIFQYPRLLGGAIWDWISPGMETKLWTLQDGSSSNNDGTIMGRPSFEQSNNSRVLSFTGHDDWIEFYRSESLDITDTQLTIAFDVYPEEIPQQNTFIAKGKHGFGIVMNNRNQLEFYIQSNNLYDARIIQHYHNNTKRISAIADVPEDWYKNWHHVSGIYNGQELRLYIDQKEVARTEFSGKIAHTPFPLCIGRDAEVHDQGELEGRLSLMKMDNLFVSDQAIEIEDIKQSNEKAVLSLDFENDTKSDSTYYSVGLGGRAYGIIWPDRTIQPEIFQIKKSAQPIAIQLNSSERKSFNIKNRHHFLNLDQYDLNWKTTLDGEYIESGTAIIDLAAQESSNIEIPFQEIDKPGEFILTCSFTLKNENRWAPKGYEVAFEQFIISKKEQQQNVSKKKVHYIDSESQIVVEGNSFKYAFNKKTGNIDQFIVHDQSFIEEGPKFSSWRAPISNDVDPWGAYLLSDEKKLNGLGRSIDNQYRALGMRDLEVSIGNVSINQLSKNQVSINLTRYANSKNLRGQFHCIEKYIIDGDGKIDIDLTIHPEGEMPDVLQKLGWSFELSKEFSDIEWYGRGKFETYPDRKTGAKVGIYSSTVDEEYVPYLMPQEHGNHTDTRWLRIENTDSHGILIKSASDKLLNFCYRQYTTDNLSRALYTHQLKVHENNILNLDFEQAGVGGTAIRQLQKYKVLPHTVNYKFSIQPY